ncbi:hypothetical protein G6F23_016079 [Rhizopus arrhizus]|nr:hypothetical protein G6F23_016079 [Rhizopus arrhizus]
MRVAGGLVIGARHVKRHAMVEDHPVAVARFHEVIDLAVDRLQVLAFGHATVHGAVQVGQEGAGAGQARAAFGRSEARRGG